MSIFGWFASSLFSLWPLLAVVVIIVLTTLLFFRKDNKYPWAEGLPEIKCGWLMGNTDYSQDMFNAQYENHYKALKGLRYGLWYNGMGDKALFILDPELAHKIQVTDFDYFVDNCLFNDYYSQVMGNVFGIVDAKGDKWRRMRKAVNPPFSLPKIKKYMNQYTKTCKEMVEFVDTQAAGGTVVHCKDFIERVAVNTLASVGFGMDINAFKVKEPEFKKRGDAMSEMWRWVLLMMVPSVAGFFRVNTYNPKAEAWFHSVIQRAIKERKNEGNTEKDILGSLIQLHETNPDCTIEVLNKSVSQFIFDGYLTTADSMHGLLAVVVTRPEIQEKLREEIDALFDQKEEGDIDLTGDDLVGMSYLENVILEYNRLFAVGMTIREATKPYKIPGSELTLPVKTKVMIPITSFQQDPEFWEHPQGFYQSALMQKIRIKLKQVHTNLLGKDLDNVLDTFMLDLR